jgi:phosphoethanolamine N-methyltransferase
MNPQDEYHSQPVEEIMRYSRESILRSEKIYGYGFQSPGGLNMVKRLCERLQIQPGIRVLEIGSGLGGAAFYFAEHYQANVVGLDNSTNMIELSTERLEQHDLSSVTFQHAGITTVELEPATFDLVWTQDCLLYVPTRDVVWNKVYQTLKLGGQLVITDFCHSADEISYEFQVYTTDCRYYLEDISSYAQALKDANFTEVIAEDITPEYVETHKAGRDILLQNSTEFLRDFSQSDLDHLVERWNKKIRFCENGDLKWGLFIARK